jgi:GNAT superfamily N-acetyltransferase
MMDFDILAEPRNQADKQALLQEVNESPFIGQMTLHELDHHIERKSILFFYEEDTLSAFSAWIPFAKDWVELGPFFTREAYRGAGLGKRTVISAIDANRALGRNMYGVTKNDVMKHIFTKHGLAETPLFKLPQPVLQYLVVKTNPARIVRGLQKLKPNEKVAHYIQIKDNSAIEAEHGSSRS